MRTTHFRGVVLAFGLLLGPLFAVDASADFDPNPGTPWEGAGDVTGNGVVNVADALCVLIAVLSDACGAGALPPCVSGPESYVDFNCDDACTVADVQLAVYAGLGQALGVVDSSASGVPDACEHESCNGAETYCDGGCVDTDSDALHCGDCDAPCTEGQVCTAGTCQSSGGGGNVELGLQQYSVEVIASGIYGIERIRYWQATQNGAATRIYWPVVYIDNASWSDGLGPQNQHWHGMHSGCGNVNGSTTCKAICQSIGGSYGAVNTNCNTNYPTTNFPGNGRNLYMQNSSGNPTGVWNTYTPDPGLGNGNNMEYCECLSVCSGGTSLCGGSCVDTMSDDAHCGGCNQPCTGGDTCVDGGCESSGGGGGGGGDVVIGAQQYSVEVIANGSYGIEKLRYWEATQSGSVTRIHWPVLYIDNASWSDGAGPQNQHWHGMHSGCGNSNGVATCKAICQALDLNYASVNTNCNTNYPTTNFPGNGGAIDHPVTSHPHGPRAVLYVTSWNV